MAYSGFNSWYMNPQSDTYRKPYGGFNSWYTDSAADVATRNPQGIMQTNPGGGGTAAGGNIASWLQQMSGGTPATPQYEAPQTPQIPQYQTPEYLPGLQMPSYPQYGNASGQSITPPSLSSVGSVSRPGALQMPDTGALQQLTTPGLNYPSAAQPIQQTQGVQQLQAPASLQMPTLTSNPINTYGEVTSPQLGAGASLTDMASATLPYQQPNYGMFQAGSQTPISYTPQQTYGQAMYQQPANVQGGMGQMPQVPQPSLGPMPLPEDQSAGVMAGYNRAQQAQGGPMQQAQIAQWLQNQANLSGGWQQAQANSGLGWGGINQNLNQLAAQGQLGQQSNILQFLGGMYGGV